MAEYDYLRGRHKEDPKCFVHNCKEPAHVEIETAAELQVKACRQHGEILIKEITRRQMNIPHIEPGNKFVFKIGKNET